MGSSDPFSTTYEGSRQALGSIGQGLQQAAASYAAKKQKKQEIDQGYLLKELGLEKEYELKGKLAETEAKAKKEYAEPKEWKPTTKEEALQFEKEKASVKSETLTPSQKLLKTKSTNDLIATSKMATEKKKSITDALSAIDKVPQGWLGGIEIAMKGGPDPNNPILTEWQKVKMVLTDAQLANMAFMKGAISDKEEKMLATAAANDDILSAAKAKPVLLKMLRFLESDEAAKKEAYIRNYGEDPDEWLQSKQHPVDEELVTKYMEKYPEKSREDIIKAMQRLR